MFRYFLFKGALGGGSFGNLALKDVFISLDVVYPIEILVRTRLHRWSFFQLQQQIEYKAIFSGLKVIYVNPAYSSKLCLQCGCLGVRHKNTFTCQCGNRQHSDLYACEKLCRFA